MKKFLDLSSWRTALGNLLPSAHGHQGGSRKAAIGSMLIMAFAVVGCDDSSSASAGPNDEPGVESSSSSSGKVTEPAEVTSSSSEKAKSSSSDTQSEVKQSSSSEKTGKSSSSTDDASSSSVKLRSSSSVGTPESSSSEISSSSAGKIESSSSSVALATPCKTETEDNCEYGTVLDDRDGQTYKTVKIGDQWWMAENLNYKTDNSFCYKDSAEYCEKYGRLYTWAAAMDSAGTWSTNGKGCGYGKRCSPTYPVRGVCPEGWHLPTQTEWNTLFTAIGGQSTAGQMLKAASSWLAFSSSTNENAFGFSALSAGNKYYYGSYGNKGYDANFWGSTEFGSHAHYMYLRFNNDNAHLEDYAKYYCFSVRCVKD
ncbi:fibrobacter succinogenes major paralogous domain-containing protein [Hallerella succinigenes]|uniref:Uncharacterized protein (TIGR02145 family) n=1 Tax=Hallerella succinigenes TaxID=1896222 RepID=A0A2M9A3B7_9BACT|nr:fibrobacter succinogenes major paralogous domain-containing protein [Hallerella succinigenes]PJJ40179.1 uncharacterized protein (TIGR02145 family) [Hallerella succinigenes]